MGRLTPQKLEALLTEYGWQFERIAVGEWVSGFAGEQRAFPVTIRLSETCVTFEVCPIVECSPRDLRLSGFARDLLELNAQMTLAKLGLSEAGEVLLTCQALAGDFGLDSLSLTLGILGYYAEELSSELGSKLESEGERPLLS